MKNRKILLIYFAFALTRMSTVSAELIEFSPNTPARAGEVNNNFTELEDRIDKQRFVFVDASDSIIGDVINTEEDRVILVTSEGYIAPMRYSEDQNNYVIDERSDLYFLSTDCQGQAYMRVGLPRMLRNLITQVYYVDGSPISINYNSRLIEDFSSFPTSTVCEQATGNLNALSAFPNDSSITGIDPSTIVYPASIMTMYDFKRL